VRTLAQSSAVNENSPRSRVGVKGRGRAFGARIEDGADDRVLLDAQLWRRPHPDRNRKSTETSSPWSTRREGNGRAASCSRAATACWEACEISASFAATRSPSTRRTPPSSSRSPWPAPRRVGNSRRSTGTSRRRKSPTSWGIAAPRPSSVTSASLRSVARPPTRSASRQRRSSRSGASTGSAPSPTSRKANPAPCPRTARRAPS